MVPAGTCSDGWIEIMKEAQVTVYSPDQKARLGLVRCLVMMVSNVVRSRELIWQLFKRDFVGGYKQTFFGIFWLFISPVVGILSWVFMQSTGILNPGSAGVPYPVYVLLGSSIWGLFMSFYSSSSASLSSGGSLILQVNFSHEALVAQQIAQTAANFSINFVMILLILLVFGVRLSWGALLFPFTLAPIFFVGAGIGMVVAVIAVVVHDVNKIVSTALGFLMFLTPVVYTPDLQNKVIQDVIKWNPMTYLVGGARDVMLYGRIDDPRGYLISAVLAALVFLFSWRLFFIAEHKVAEKI